MFATVTGVGKYVMQEEFSPAALGDFTAGPPSPALAQPLSTCLGEPALLPQAFLVKHLVLSLPCPAPVFKLGGLLSLPIGESPVQ